MVLSLSAQNSAMKIESEDLKLNSLKVKKMLEKEELEFEQLNINSFLKRNKERDAKTKEFIE